MAKKCIKYGKNTYKPNILFDKIRNNPEFFAKKHGITGADVENVLGIGANNNIDFQIIGEKGAQNLSDAENIMANNKIAKEMEEAGKDAKTIRLATGWEKGVDGKWRFELDYNATQKQPTFTKNADGHYETTLDELIDYPMLFAAYPQLRDTKVIIANFGNSEADMSATDKVIYLNEKYYNTNSDGKLQSALPLGTLLHEQQHLIQSIEGFSRGTDNRRIANIIINELRGQGREIGSNNERVAVRNYLEKEYGKDWKTKLEGWSANQFRELADTIYTKFAGEVEARNVAFRKSIAESTRKTFSPKHSVDIANEEQVIVKQLASENTTFIPLTLDALNALVERLKKPFAKAFGNLNVVTDWNEFVDKVKKLGNKVDFNIIGKIGANPEQLLLLSKAVKLENSKYTPEEIVFETGWFKGLDGKWRTTTNSDVELNVNDFEVDKEYKLSDLISHEDLFKSYPNFKDISVIFKQTTNEGNASYNGQTNTIAISGNNFKGMEQHLRRLFQHEIQHAIQGVEQFARGSNRAESGRAILDTALAVDFGIEKTDKQNKINDYLKNEYGDNWTENINDQIFIQKASQSIYEILVGEFEASTAEELIGLPYNRSLFALKMLQALGNKGIVVFGSERLDDMQFMHTPNGEVYGAKLPDGTIYLNPNKLNANTAIHEFSHLWEQLMPNTFKKGVELLKQTKTGKDIFNRLKEEGNYSHLTDEQLWNEAMNTHIGEYGEWQQHNPKGKMAEFKQWLKDFFGKIGEVLGIKNVNPDTKLRQFTENVLGDMLGSRPLFAEQDSTNTNTETQFNLVGSKPIPKKDIKAVRDEMVATKDLNKAFEVLKQSNWYKGLKPEKQSEITTANFGAYLIDSAKVYEERNIEASKRKVEKVTEKKDVEIKDIKTSFKEKFQQLKDDYKSKLAEIKKSNKEARQKVREIQNLRTDAINSIRGLITDKAIKNHITPNEISTLLGKAEKIGTSRNFEKAITEFEKYFDKVYDNAEQRKVQNKDDWKEFTPNEDSLEADPTIAFTPAVTTKKNKFKQFREKWFSNQGGVLKPILNDKDRAIGKTNMELRIARTTIAELTNVANKIKFNTDENWSQFDNAMKGDTDAYNTLPEEIKPFVSRMRNQIDGLSNFLIVNNLVTQEQALNINDNLGMYVTRGYSYFDGTSTFEGVSKQFYRALFKNQNSISSKFDANKWADAITVFQQNVLNDIAYDKSGKYSHLTTEQDKQSYARTRGESMLLEYIASMEADYKKQGSSVGADTSVLEKKQDVPEPIRKLLGEYTDPRTSFALTISRISQLAYQREFMQNVREMGMGTLFFDAKDANIPNTHYVKIASDGNDAFSPLNGLYTTPEFKEAFLDVSEQTANDAVKLWMKITGMVKVGKTVLSPITQAVNFFANPGFLINNGTITDVKQVGKLVQVFWDDIKGNKGKTNDIIQELIEENILGQNVNFNEIEKDFGVNIEKEFLRSVKQSTMSKTAHDILSIPFRMYRASDDAFKAFAYYAEADRYAKSIFKKSYKELTGEDRLRVRKIASEVVKNTMPNYDRRYKAADAPRKATYNLVGNFLAFQAESIRTKINTIQIGLNDLKNPETKSVGIKRLAGVMAYNTIYATVTTYLGKLSGMGLAGLLGFFDDDDEDDKNNKFNLIAPNWARSTEKYVKRENDGSITYWTYGNSNPYGIWYKAANAYKNGSSNSNGGLISVFDEALTPFLGTEMSAQWALNTFIKEENDYGVKLLTTEDKKKYTWEKLSPTIFKVVKDNTDTNKNNDFDVYNMAGIKKYNFSPTEQLGFKFRDVQDKVNNLGTKMYSLELKFKKGSINEKELNKQKGVYESEQKKLLDEFKPIYDAYVSFGADTKIIEKQGEKKYVNKFNSMSNWMDYLQTPIEQKKNKQP